MRVRSAALVLAMAAGIAIVPAGAGSAVYGERSLDGAYGYSFGEAGVMEYSVAIAPYTGGAVTGGWTQPEDDSTAAPVGMVARFNGGGDQLWKDTLSTVGNVYVQDVAASPFGIVAVGNTSGSLAGPLAGEYDGFIRFYTADGDLVWQAQVGTGPVDGNGGQDSVESAVLANGHLYVSGYTHGSLDGPSAGDADAFVRKYTPDGTLVWGRQFGTSAPDAAMELAAAGDLLYMASYTRQAWPGAEAVGDADVVVQALTTGTGDPVWTNQLGTAAYDSVEALAVDEKAVYVGGATLGVFPGASATGDTRDGWVASLDLTGTITWTRQLVTMGEVRGLAAARPGVVAAGISTGPSGVEAFVSAYDETGAAVWTRKYGTDSRGAIFEDAAPAPGGVLVVGAGNSGLFGSQVGQSDSYVVRFALHQPDGSARVVGSPTVGRDVYAPHLQTTTARVARGERARFVVSVQNDSDVAEAFRLRGCGDRAGVRVRYFVGTTEITAAVLAGWRSPVVARGGSRSITVIVRARPRAELGTRSCTVVQRSADRLIGLDRVILGIRVVR